MKKTLLTGFIILTPVALTIMVIVFLFDFFTGPFFPVVSTALSWFEAQYHFTLPHGLALFISRLFALILLCVFILLLGAVARWFLIKQFLHWTHLLFSRIPFIKSVYKVSRDIFGALFSSDGKKAFKEVVLVPFPRRPSFAVGFHAGEVAEECQKKVKTPLKSVFMPTAPHPISGFLFLVPEKDVYKIDMTNEEALKFLVSCGMIHPGAEKAEADEII
jgi:uncharacterized membrane protein